MALIVVPARYASTRYPGKPLVELKGSTGQSQTLIERSWRAALAVKGDHRVIVATEDQRIADAALGFGAEVAMTSDACRNGTERCAEVMAQVGFDGVVVNLQGDAPLTPPWFVDDLISAMGEDESRRVATPVLRCDADALNGFLEDRANNRVGGTTAVFDNSNRALYFSKEVIPYTGRRFEADEVCPVFHHVGVYAYRSEDLAEYTAWGEGKLETWEGLEQLRFMENGTDIHCVEVDAKGRKFWELNNPIDVARIEAIMQEQDIK